MYLYTLFSCKAFVQLGKTSNSNLACVASGSIKILLVIWAGEPVHQDGQSHTPVDN